MKTLNETATRTFNKIVEMAEKENGYIKIENNVDYMPVSVEILERNEKVIIVSVAQYFEQNGDLMADPEMLFYIMNGFIIPSYFKQDSLGIEKESTTFENGNLIAVNQKMQANQTAFANQWFKNIKFQHSIK